MKEEILAEIENIKSILKYPIYYLKDRLDDADRFNYYWDVLEFINWVKSNHTPEYEDYGLENHYQQIIDFGYFYVQVFNPQPTPLVYEDGVLSIGIPIEQMITQLYDHAINLNDSEATDLKIVLDSINLLRDTVLKSNSGADAKVLAKEVLKEVISPEKETKKLNKKEQIELMAKNFSDTRKLNLLKKQSKR